MNTEDNLKWTELRRRINRGEALAQGELRELLRLNGQAYRESQRKLWPIKGEKKNDTAGNQREGTSNQTDQLIRQGGR
jgi:hypothetical protein